MSARSQTRTMFTRDIVSDRRQLTLYGGTLIAIVLATELERPATGSSTPPRSPAASGSCACSSPAGLIVVEEITKLVLRRREHATHEPAQ